MNVKGMFSWSISGRVAILFALLFGPAMESARAQGTYQVGTVVTNFTIYLRRTWTNEAGRIFAAGTPMRLSDFSGSVLFVEFFDPT
jgi:hypothetical protein